MRRPFLTTVMAMLVITSFCHAQSWRQWRGPNRDGILPATPVPEVWPQRLTPVWEIELGEGYASPVMGDGLIFTHTRVAESEVVSAIRLQDGELMWRHKYPAPFTKNQYAVTQGKGPFATPTYHDGRLYALGVNGLLLCLDAQSGKVVWQSAFKERVDTSKLFCGAAMSPLITDNVCIVHVGDDVDGALIGHDPETGERMWTWREQGPGYASPIRVEIQETPQVVTLTDEACISVAPETGELLWQVPFRDEWHENIVTPVAYGESIILSGVRRGTLAIRPTKNAHGWTTEQLWFNEEVPMYMSSPVVIDGILLGLSSKRKGHFFSLDPQTGKVLWQSAGRDARNAAFVVSGKTVLAATVDGDLLVMKPTGAGLEEVRRYEVANRPVWAHPILLPDGVVIKDEVSLTRLDY